MTRPPTNQEVPEGIPRPRLGSFELHAVVLGDPATVAFRRVAGDTDIPGYTRRMLADADRELLLNRGVGSALVDFLEMWRDLVDVEPPSVLPFADGQATATCDPSDHSKIIIALSLADVPTYWHFVPPAFLGFSATFGIFTTL